MKKNEKKSSNKRKKSSNNRIEFNISSKYTLQNKRLQQIFKKTFAEIGLRKSTFFETSTIIEKKLTLLCK